MKVWTVSAALAVGSLFVVGAVAPSLAHAQSNVNISVGINQPGVYGRVDFGNAPPPPVIYQQPVIIAPPPRELPRRPIYLRVPPGYEQNWGQYCGRYAACGQPVYFVRYDPRYEPPPRRLENRRDDRRDDRKDWRRDDRHDDRHDRGRGPKQKYNEDRDGPRHN